MSSIPTAIAAEIDGLASLEKILTWMQDRGVPLDRIDLVAQDEFCHDLFVPWQQHWIIFGLT